MKIRIFLLVVLMVSLAGAQAQVAEDRGAMGLSQALKRLDVVASVLHTGAHPDDENSALLAWLARGQGARTAYLSATRGEGGQNLVGPELFEALGVIRSEELLAARRLDGAQQYFTPNYEFGFSKSAEEGLTKWGRQQILGDFVRVIREFRPEIIVSRFTGTPSDGHGHHQVAGLITREAFRAAADATLFPEYGRPWQAKKLYLNQGPQGGQAVPGSITLNVGEFDAALGRSYAEIAAEGRSMHRSQSQGAAQEKGPRTTQVQLIQKTSDVFDTAPLFSGVLYKLPDLAQLDAALADDLRNLQQRVDAIRQKVNLIRPAEVIADLTAALQQLRQIQAKTSHEHVQFLLKNKESDFLEAVRLAAGLVLDVTVSDDVVVPGQEFDLMVSVINGGPMEFSSLRSRTELPANWDITSQGSTGTLLPGQRLDQKFKVRVAANADFSQPYWLRSPRRGDRFQWPNMPMLTPVGESLLPTVAEVDVQGVTIQMTKTAEFRLIDRMLGEQRVELKVAPALSVNVSPANAILPLRGARQKELTVTVENQNPSAIDGEAHLIVPQGWQVTPASQPVRFTRQGEKASLQFTVTAPSAPGDFTIQAVVRAGGQEYRRGFTPIAYPHIEARNTYADAQSKVAVVDVATTVTSLGYVEGTGDMAPDSLRQLGINVTVLSDKDIASGDLSKFPVIVLGIRAYSRNDMKAYNKRFMDYVENGGTLIVQYNRQDETGTIQLGPYPFTFPNNNVNNAERVTFEDAPVRILEPNHPVLNVPNKITAADFEGWVDERGTYFLANWDPQYTALLESNDPGEPPRRGGLLVAKAGRGAYVYAGYSFFRQLPAGVKGAYRLFANLVSIEK